MTRELLSEVLGINCTDIELPLKGNMLGFYIDNVDFIHLINIYELAHKCKEWAKKYRIYLLSGYAYGFGAYCFDDNQAGHQYFKTKCPSNTDMKTEPEAIFKACEWILEQKER